MNLEIGTKAAQFPEKEYKNWILVAVKAVKILRSSYVPAGCSVKSVRGNFLRWVKSVRGNFFP
jgi:hypothetical protein